MFRTTPAICADIWNEFGTSVPKGGSYKHLLWGCSLLKVYGNEAVFCTLVGADSKAWRKWSWEFVELISNLKVVSLYFFIFSNDIIL